MKIKIDEESYFATVDTTWLAMQGECITRSVFVEYPTVKGTTDYFLRVEMPDMTVYDLKIVNNQVVLTNTITAYAAVLPLQWIAKDNTGAIIAKSQIIHAVVKDSIDGDSSALPTPEAFQTKYNECIGEMSSIRDEVRTLKEQIDDGVNPEVTQARVDANGTSYATLKERLDSTDENVEKIESVSTELKGDLGDLNNAVFVIDDMLTSVEYTTESKSIYGKIGDAITIKETTNRAVLSFSPVIGKTYRVKFNQIGNGYGTHAVFICDSNNQILSVYDGEGVEEGLDAWHDFEIDILVNETNAHVVYVQAQKASKLDVKVHENIKTDSKEGRIQDLTNRVESLEEINRVLPKPVLVMRFDGWNTTDGRFDMLKEYGFTATVGAISNKSINIETQKASIDIGIYRTAEWPFDTYGNDALSDNPTQEVIDAWDSYVKGGIELHEAYGIINPTAWLCRQNKACVGLTIALKKYGIKMCSGYMPDLSTTANLTDTFNYVTSVEGIYPNTFDYVVCKLRNAISEGKGFCVLTHGIYATEAEANSNFGITESKLRAFFDIVKSYVDNGELIVSNYREVYNLYDPIDANRNDYTRLLKMAFST